MNGTSAKSQGLVTPVSTESHLPVDKLMKGNSKPSDLFGLLTHQMELSSDSESDEESIIGVAGVYDGVVSEEKMKATKKVQALKRKNKKQRHLTRRQKQTLQQSQIQYHYQQSLYHVIQQYQQTMESVASRQASTEQVLLKIASALEQEKVSTVMFNRLCSSHRTALIRGSAVRASVEPTEIVDTCTRLFEATSQYAGFRELHEKMRNSGIYAEYSPAHLEAICRKGIIWSVMSSVEYLTVFAAFPVGGITKNMMNKAEDLEMRKQYGLDLKDEDLDFLRKRDIFLPQTVLDAIEMLRTYCILLDILFGSKSIVCKGIRGMLHFFENNQRLISKSQNPGQLITRVLYGMDLRFQNFLLGISDSQVPMPRAPFQEFLDGLSEIQNRVGYGFLEQQVPQIFNKNFNDSNRRVYRNANEDE